MKGYITLALFGEKVKAWMSCSCIMLAAEPRHYWFDWWLFATKSMAFCYQVPNSFQSHYLRNQRKFQTILRRMHLYEIKDLNKPREGAIERTKSVSPSNFQSRSRQCADTLKIPVWLSRDFPLHKFSWYKHPGWLNNWLFKKLTWWGFMKVGIPTSMV